MQEEEFISMGRRCIELSDELWAMPEHKLYRDLQGIDLSISTFYNNYVILDTFLTFLTSDTRAHHIFTVRNRDKLREAGRHVVSCLHNYVASAQSLVDHSRKLYRGELNKSIQSFPDYEERVKKDFANDPLARFVICLRTYCQHYKAPSISVLTTNPGGRLVRKVQLPLSSLYTFKDWNSEAKVYLGTVEEGVDIQQVATTYHDRVMAFHQWVQERYDEIYAEDFKRFREKEREVLLLQLEINIENYLLYNLQKNNISEKLDIFTHVLFSEDFAQLEQDSLTQHERACLAITFYEQKLEIPLPDKIKEKIFQIFC